VPAFFLQKFLEKLLALSVRLWSDDRTMNQTIPITSCAALSANLDKQASFAGSVIGVTTLPTGSSRLDVLIGDDTIPVIVSGHQSADLINEDITGRGHIRANKSGQVALVATSWQQDNVTVPTAPATEPLPPAPVAMLRADDTDAKLNRLEAVYERCRMRAMSIGVKDVDALAIVFLQLMEGK